jgi:hypothetical protein
MVKWKLHNYFSLNIDLGPKFIMFLCKIFDVMINFWSIYSIKIMAIWRKKIGEKRFLNGVKIQWIEKIKSSITYYKDVSAKEQLSGIFQ